LTFPFKLILHFSLCWFILGKHSDVVFTENTNTGLILETNLLDETSCLTRQLLISSEIYRCDEFNRSTDLTKFVSESGETYPKIPKESIDLLDQYELSMSSMLL